jgi:hypothetical protein
MQANVDHATRRCAAMRRSWNNRRRSADFLLLQALLGDAMIPMMLLGGRESARFFSSRRSYHAINRSARFRKNSPTHP